MEVGLVKAEKAHSQEWLCYCFRTTQMVLSSIVALAFGLGGRMTVRNFISIGLSVLLILSTAPLARPQGRHDRGALTEEPQQQPKQQQPVIRTTTRLVEVSVVVQDKNGNPITGLTKEDFKLFDQGKQQSIALFSGSSPVPVSVAPRAPLPPNMFTNRFDQKGEEPGAVTVILFDTLNTSVRDQQYVRKQILRFLQTLKPQDHVALYALTTELLVLHDFTQDDSALVTAVGHYTPKELAAFDASNTPPVNLISLGADPQWANLQNAVNNANAEIGDQQAMDRVGTTAGAIEAIADHVASIPGHKSLVWVSGGFPIQLGTPSIGRRSFRSI